MLKFTAGKILLSHSKTFSRDRKRQFNAFLTNVAWQLVIYMICWFLHFVTISEKKRMTSGLWVIQDSTIEVISSILCKEILRQMQFTSNYVFLQSTKEMSGEEG
jgi:hypothetical protein